VRLYRGGQLSYVAPPSPQTEGLRDLMRCRDDLRCARTAARHRVSKQLLRHGRIYRDGNSQWTLVSPESVPKPAILTCVNAPTARNDGKSPANVELCVELFHDTAGIDLACWADPGHRSTCCESWWLVGCCRVRPAPASNGAIA
jgi:hypothetical protein